jgi:predicted MFS family arabinose efflux permease
MSKYYKTLLSAVLITFASLGLGRFSYGMILPDLQSSLQVSTTKIGFISTANFTGYLIAIFFVSYIYKRYEASLLMSISLSLQGISMLAMILFSDYLYISFFYMLSGFFAAVANISIMIYISHVIPLNMKGKALGITVTGIGFAIMFTGYFVPYIETMINNNAWKTNWAIFSILVILISFFIKSGLKKHDNKQHQTTIEHSTKEIFSSSKFYKITFLYLVFGITYVVYMTFFAKANIDKYSISSHDVGFFWSVLGIMSIFSGPLFGILSDKIGAY